MNMCPDCNKEITYPKQSTYKDLWFRQKYDDKGKREYNVYEIMCPHCITTVIKEESADPDRYVLEFGKHNGLRLSEVPESYLKFLKKDTSKDKDTLLHECIKEQQRREAYKLTLLK